MEYIVSARKYRPMSFDSVVGQQALTTTLKNAVKSGKLAHAYLFCGPRGVGKTTCARIFAKAINCEHPHEDGEACNECESCKAFNEQRSYNIFELDAASNNGVEQIKELMEQTRIPPQVGRYKVFIIDEVHMLSTQAFNAFLKTLEEPPQHVVFILATTEKHKLLPTILSRCQIYDFERMSVQQIVDHLKRVAAKEGVEYEDEALSVIAEKADGGMRDALSIFDQVVSYCQGKITYEKVLEDLNVLDADNYFRIVDLALENKVKDIMLLLNSLIAKGFDGGLLIGGLAAHVRNVMMARDEATLPLLEVSDAMRGRYREQARKCTPKFLYQALRVMNQCDINYRQSTNKRLLVELTLIEIAQITQEDDAAGAGRSPKRLKSLFQKLISSTATKTERQGTVAGRSAVAAAPQQAVAGRQYADAAPARQAPVRTGDKKKVGMSFKSILKGPKQPAYMQARQAATADDAVKPFTQDDLSLAWREMCVNPPEELRGMGQRLRNTEPVIKEYPMAEIVVTNPVLYGQMMQRKDKIRQTVCRILKNNAFDFTARVAEREETGRLMTQREVYDMIRKEHPAIDRLCQLLKLELG